MSDTPNTATKFPSKLYAVTETLRSIITAKRMTATWADMLVSTSKTSDGRICLTYDIDGAEVVLTKGVDDMWYWFSDGDDTSVEDGYSGEDQGPFACVLVALIDIDIRYNARWGKRLTPKAS